MDLGNGSDASRILDGAAAPAIAKGEIMTPKEIEARVADDPELSDGWRRYNRYLERLVRVPHPDQRLASSGKTLADHVAWGLCQDDLDTVRRVLARMDDVIRRQMRVERRRRAENVTTD